MTLHQGRLFDTGHPDLPAIAPAQAHSDTSRAAAATVEKHLGRLQQIALDWLRGRGALGATDQEGSDWAMAEHGWSEPTFRVRRIECMHAGLVLDSGQRRPVRSGNKAVVWVAKEFAAVPF